MPTKFSLDTVFIQGKTYETPERVALAIKRLGTDATSACHLKVEGKDLGDLITTVAPMHITSSNKLGLLDLGDAFYVVPPDTKFEVDGPSGAKMRAKGLLIRLAPGETLPGDLATRFDEQVDRYLTYVEGTYSHGTDVALVADGEVEVVSLTPKTIEEYLFAYPVLAAISNYTPAEGDLGIRFLIDNAYLDEVMEETKVGGIDILSAPRPPADTTEEEAFTLCESPIRVLGDHTLSVKVRNTKGADISPAAGTSLTFTIDLITQFKRTR